MKMLLVDVKNCVVKPVDVNGLNDYYDLIGCRCIDIVNRQIGKRRFEIICDDEGLLVDKPIMSAVSYMGEPMLMGNLLIAGGEVIDGDLTPITDVEIEYIKEFMFDVLDLNDENRVIVHKVVMMNW